MLQDTKCCMINNYYKAALQTKVLEGSDIEYKNSTTSSFMIPINLIREHQYGGVRNTVAPKIDLGGSLARQFGALDRKPTEAAVKPTPQPKKSIATGARKVIAARRISDVFANLPKLSEGSLMLKPKREENRRSTILGRDDLRLRRLQLQDIGINKRSVIQTQNSEEVFL